MKLFTFFLILCAWNYPFQPSSFRNSSSKSNLNNILGELRGRLLKGGTSVERHAQDAVLRERLVNILHDDDETIKVRLNELIQEEKRKKNVESILRYGNLPDELPRSSKSGKGASASKRQCKPKKKANIVRIKDESTDSLNFSNETYGSTDSLSGSTDTDSSTGSLNGEMDHDASTVSLSLRSDYDASTESLSIESTKHGSTTTLDSLQLDKYLEKEFEDELSYYERRESINLGDKYYEQDTITEKMKN
ncbi:hypothetical protein PCYB_005580 [Plasmodium cynomolgi strain B]|uniref:Merozoite surface protein 7 n=1 Tax=Plasmodium cynomolgi (strain B) TaxID=1120755 RepID=K6V0F7_PLACD|nr:hypothetical protein PCYB_005580 [Plasmodium cynomolgi strain B]GAB69809.1 hypothetical protein PCYB_005580 [Plasmodium cynomolgi strain B]